ncbi:MAG: aminoglycoside phosphotransferase family protein [Myxococcota bacterium]
MSRAHLHAVVASIPDALRRCLRDVHGAQATQTWLDALPDLLLKLSHEHGLHIMPVHHPLSYNVVLPAHYQGQPAVLKMSVPGPDMEREVRAVHAYQGHGMVRCLSADPEEGWLLLEALQPGTSLLGLPDDEAMSIVAAIMDMLHRAPLDPELPRLGHWVGGFERLRAAYGGGCGPFSPRSIAQAEPIIRAGAVASADDVLLHGDLHHANILRDGERWCAIDPKGVIGPRHFEPAAAMRNDLDPAAPDLKARLERRAAVLCDRLGMERRTVLESCLAQTMLSAIWTWEDHGAGWEPELCIVRALERLLER